MAEAQGSLSSASHAVEGVPLPSTECPFSISSPQVQPDEPGNSKTPNKGIADREDGPKAGALFSKGNLEIGAPAPLPQKAQLEGGKRLLFHFVEDFLQIELFGFQSGFGVCPDSLLFVGPHGSTLAVPVDILLEPREIALQFVQEKIRKSAEAFSKRPG